jgi:endonuclease/exonuclease/phosphatase family metal-dependent hydrolase
MAIRVRILSLNCWLLPPPISSNNGERLKKIIRLIKGKKAEVVTLQEVWFGKYISEIRKSLPEYHIVPQKEKFYNRGGLVTLSKYKPIKVKNYTFPLTKNHNIIEKIARKGFTEITIRKKAGEITIINTHLNDPINEKERAINESQFRIIKKRARKKKNFIISGDLNMKEEDVEKLSYNSFHFNKGIFKNSHNPNQNYIIDNTHAFAKRLDYIMSKKRPGIIVKEVSSFLKKPLVSDHFALMSAITIL